LVVGPDAAIASPADMQGELVWVVSRPVYDRDGGGRTTVDPRTLIALESPDRATWLVCARVGADAGLRLSEAMDQTLRAAPPGHPLHLNLTFADSIPGPVVSGRRVVDGGHWRWDGLIEREDDAVYTMTLCDAEGDELARVDMDVATARNLYEHLSRVIRAAPARFAGGTNSEQAR
jgi:hypothetical protein